MSADNFSYLRRRLLGWYDAHRRDLPWRRTRDPYAIWISETMLQQTQVASVIRYYERFLDTFPTVAALGRAPLKNVLALWSGLGYYRRAQNLKKAASVITREHGGHMPDRYEALRALPGIGDYTAGALMSIAFDKPYPAVDGNVRRVLSRLFVVKDQGQLRELALRLVAGKRPGDFNQSLMELGATLCTAAAPRCGDCPVASRCAQQRGPARSSISSAKKSRRSSKVTWPLAIVCHHGKILLRRRAVNGLLAGLWELPGGELKTKDTVYGALRHHLGALSRGALGKQRRIGTLRHAITHRNIRAPVFLVPFADNKSTGLPRSRWRWIAPSQLQRYPVSSMTSKALKIFAAHEKSSR